MKWALRPSALPGPHDRLNRAQEMIYYYLLWCQVNRRPVRDLRRIGHELGSGTGQYVSHCIRRLHDLGLVHAVATKAADGTKLSIDIAALRAWRPEDDDLRAINMGEMK